MVSGWDKSPGPTNDYATPLLTRWQLVKLITVMMIFYGIIVAARIIA